MQPQARDSRNPSPFVQKFALADDELASWRRSGAYRGSMQSDTLNVVGESRQHTDSNRESQVFRQPQNQDLAHNFILPQSIKK